LRFEVRQNLQRRPGHRPRRAGRAVLPGDSEAPGLGKWQWKSPGKPWEKWRKTMVFWGKMEKSHVFLGKNGEKPWFFDVFGGKNMKKLGKT
jgi:hypothetical protein